MDVKITKVEHDYLVAIVKNFKLDSKKMAIFFSDFLRYRDFSRDWKEAAFLASFLIMGWRQNFRQGLADEAERAKFDLVLGRNHALNRLPVLVKQGGD